MEKTNKPKKNHWTQTNVDTATKKINQEIYGKNRQAPIHIKLDDLSVFINEKITRRGIAKGMVSVQENFNINILEVEKILEEGLIDGCCSCRKGKGTDYALNLLKTFLIETSNHGKRDCFF